jgi:nucleotidyltransferase substrate binding protein (TIGR01987 family)
MKLRTEHFSRCLETLQHSLERLRSTTQGSVDFEIYRNAVVKGFELTLETGCTLLRKALKAYMANPGGVNNLNFKDVLRHAAKHGLIENSSLERWFSYRDSRNMTAHDYGVDLAEETLKLLEDFLGDARQLQLTLERLDSQP